MKLFNKSTLLALFFLILPFNAQGQDNAWNNYTLEGIGGVFVRTSTNAACELAGINTNETQAVVERTLLESEVELLTEQEMLRNSIEGFFTVLSKPGYCSLLHFGQDAPVYPDDPRCSNHIGRRCDLVFYRHGNRRSIRSPNKHI